MDRLGFTGTRSEVRAGGGDWDGVSGGLLTIGLNLIFLFDGLGAVLNR